MSKMKFFCLPEKISINLKNQIYITQEASNSILHKFHHKYKETTSELSFFPQPSMSRLLPAEHFNSTREKNLKHISLKSQSENVEYLVWFIVTASSD